MASNAPKNPDVVVMEFCFSTPRIIIHICAASAYRKLYSIAAMYCDAKRQAPSAKRQTPNAKRQIPNTKYQIPNTKYQGIDDL